MIRSLLGLGGGSITSESAELTNSSQESSSSTTTLASEVKIDTAVVKDGETALAPSIIDEEAIKEAVDSYADMERLAPFRTKQLLKKALKDAPPNEPAPDVS
jgi:hypothetical protein